MAGQGQPKIVANTKITAPQGNDILIFNGATGLWENVSAGVLTNVDTAFPIEGDGTAINPITIDPGSADTFFTSNGNEIAWTSLNLDSDDMTGNGLSTALALTETTPDENEILGNSFRLDTKGRVVSVADYRTTTAAWTQVQTINSGSGGQAIIKANNTNMGDEENFPTMLNRETGQYTASTAGWYRITINASWDSNVNGIRRLRLLVNGVVQMSDARGADCSDQQCCFMVYSNQPGNIWSLAARQDSGSSLECTFQIHIELAAFMPFQP